MAANRLAVSSSTPADSSAGAAGRDRDRDAADDAADEPGAPEVGGGIIRNDTFAPPTRTEPAGATSSREEDAAPEATAAARRASRSAMNLLLRPANGPLVRWVAAGKGGPSRRRGGRGGGGRAPDGALHHLPHHVSKLGLGRGVFIHPPVVERRGGVRSRGPAPRRSLRADTLGSWPAVSSSVGGRGAHRRRAARAPRRSPCDPRRRETRAEARGAAPRCPHRGPARARPSRDPGGGCATRRVVPFDESVVDADDRFSSRLAADVPGNDRHFRGGSPRAGHSSCARRGSRRVHESTVVRRTTRREASRVQLLAASLCS